MSIGSFIQSNTQEGAFTAVNSSAATMVDKEGYFVTPTGNMVTLEAASGGKYMEMKVCTEVTDDPIYLLQAGAAASKPIEVLPLSPHRNLRCVAGGTITANELLTVHSDGTAVSAVNGSTIIGYAEEDAAAGGYVKFRPVMIGDQYKAAGHVNVDAVTGAGTTNADAAALPFVPGGFCLATGAANSGVILPAGTSIGYTYDVYIGQATNAMKVYPPPAGTLNGNTHTTAGVSCAAWSLTRFINTNGTNWVAAEIPSAG